MSELSFKQKETFSSMSEEELIAAQRFCEDYKKFLDASKIEYYGVKNAVAEAEKAGFVPFEYGKKYSAGDKIYHVQKGHAAIFATIGRAPFEEGFNLVAAHVDCPRLDLKLSPLYEDGGLCLLKTHYYGGILKYQWVTNPLMLIGAVYKKDGSVVEINIGGDERDPVFCISDLLPHLGKDQAGKKLSEAFTGEDLNIIAGSRPDAEEEKDKIKTTVLKLLNEKYGINEEDLLTAEISAVPAGKARDLGLDRSMILAFGHDDRVCAYPAFKALLDAGVPNKTAVCVFADREEVGSMGVTGLRSDYLKNFIEELCVNASQNVRKALANSAAISSDVTAAFDPDFASAFEKNNTAYLNKGCAICKFTGARGKSGSSEASARFIAKLCAIFDKNDVVYQFGELGKVDQGGGGTVAQFLADKDIENVDIGVPLLSMHAPYEIAAKNDIYMMYKSSLVFYKEF